MSDYISKEKLMSHIESQYKSFGEDYDALQILGDIEDFPTEERPHGEWVWKKDKDSLRTYDLLCSKCGCKIFTCENYDSLTDEQKQNFIYQFLIFFLIIFKKRLF